jgi:penicillin-binding protein 1A
VVDRNGKPIGEYFERAPPAGPVRRDPQHVIDAFVSAEDQAFFEHKGIDFTGILRARGRTCSRAARSRARARSRSRW